MISLVASPPLALFLPGPSTGGRRDPNPFLEPIVSDEPPRMKIEGDCLVSCGILALSAVVVIVACAVAYHVLVGF